MRTLTLAFLLLAASTGLTFAQTKSVEDEKFVFLNNGATVGMIIKSVLKADQQRLKLTPEQIPKAKQIITDATVKYNEGVKQMKKTGLNQKKLRVFAIEVETEKARNYKAILTPAQYAILQAQHRKMYPESKV
jgi:hypothetical protein